MAGTEKKTAIEYLTMNLEGCRKQKEVLVEEVYKIPQTESTLARRRILFSEIDQITGQIQAYLVALRIVCDIREQETSQSPVPSETAAKEKKVV